MKLKINDTIPSCKVFIMEDGKPIQKNIQEFFKGKKEVASASPGMAAIPTTMNKGGGMDMGHKPRPRGNPGVVETVVGKGGDYIKDLIN